MKPLQGASNTRCSATLVLNMAIAADLRPRARKTEQLLQAHLPRFSEVEANLRRQRTRCDIVRSAESG